MALSSTVYTLDVDLADSDRGVYETLSLRLARNAQYAGIHFPRKRTPVQV